MNGYRFANGTTGLLTKSEVWTLIGGSRLYFAAGSQTFRVGHVFLSDPEQEEDLEFVHRNRAT